MHPDILKTRKRLIVHADCADGIASAMIIRDVLPDIEVVEVQYGTERHRALERWLGDIYCDFSPHREMLEMAVTSTDPLVRSWLNDVVVLDHHKQAKDLVLSFPRGVFADEEEEPGVSGAMLAYREVWEPLSKYVSRAGLRWTELAATRRVQSFAFLAGTRDTWQRNDPRWVEACEQADALRFYGLLYFISGHDPWLSDEEWLVAELLHRKRLDAIKRQAAAVWLLDGVAYMNSLDTSDVAEELRTSGSEAKMLAGFAFRADPTTGELQLVWSLRSIAPGVDVGAMAKARGGGGHTRAAGFSEKALSPYHYDHRREYPFDNLVLPLGWTDGQQR